MNSDKCRYCMYIEIVRVSVKIDIRVDSNFK